MNSKLETSQDINFINDIYFTQIIMHNLGTQKHTLND